MSLVIVHLKRGADRDDFIRDLEAVGLRWEGFRSLKHSIKVFDVSESNFPLKSHPAVKRVIDGDKQIKGAAQTITINPDRTCDGGGWPLLRHTHRDPPWNNVGLRFPIQHEFSCERTGLGVDFYICDSGVRPDHAEWGSRTPTIVWEFESVGGDDHGHGTACTSMATGLTCGFARDAEIFSAKCLSSSGSGSFINIATAIDECLTHYLSRSELDRPAVMNLSLEGSASYLGDPAEECAEAGMVVCAAAGNSMQFLDDNDINVYPAETNGVITVGGIQMSDLPYNTGLSGSNYGTVVDILAGSQYCWMASHTAFDAYKGGNGTSYGCAYTTGVVACLLQGYRRLTNWDQVMEVHKYIYRTATFGRYKPDSRQHPMTPAILYIDPGPGPYEPIPLLEPKT